MTSAASFVYTYSVTQADVIWVVGQIKAELEQFQLLYPDFISDGKIEEFTHALRIFLFNDAISSAEMIIGRESSGGHYISDDQRVFVFDHDPRQGRASFEQPVAARKFVTPGARVHSFMTFNDKMKRKSRTDQAAVLSTTAWGGCVPGASTALVTYASQIAATGQAWSRNLGVTRWQ